MATSNININHNVSFAGMESLETALNTLAEKIGASGTGNSDKAPSQEPPTSSNKGAGESRAENNISQVGGKFGALSSRIDTLVSSFTALEASMKKLSGLDRVARLQAFQSDPKKYEQFQEAERKYKLQAGEDVRINREKNNAQRSEQRWGNIGQGIVAASLMALMYQAGNVGSVVGGEAKSVNVGAAGYNDFMKSYYNQRLDTQKTMGTTAMMGAGGMIGSAVGGMLGFGLPGMLIGGAAASIGSYFWGKDTEKKKALNELAMQQDISSYRMRARGISDLSGNTMKLSSDVLGKDIDVQLTKLQDYMVKNGGSSPYMTYLPQIMSGARQDTFSNQAEKDVTRRIRGQATFVEQITEAAVHANTSDLGGLSRNVTNISAMSGKNPLDTLTKLTNDNLRYGGDIVSNTGKIVQLMQSSAMSEKQASDLVNRQQFNDPAIQQAVNVRQAPYMNKIVGKEFMRLAGASEDELRAGQFSEESLAKYRKINENPDLMKANPRAMLMQMAFGLIGQNPYISSTGGVTPNQLGTNEKTKAQDEFNKLVAQNIGQMMVNAQTVIINGNLSSGHIENAVVQKNAPPPMGKYNTNTDLKNAVAGVGEDQAMLDYIKNNKSFGDWDRAERAKAMQKINNLASKDRTGTGKPKG